MADLDAVKPSPVLQNEAENQTLAELMKLTEPPQNPFQKDFQETIRECFDFKELRQWKGDDVQLLLADDTPAIPADRIGRNLDTIRGIRENTGNKKKFVEREPADLVKADLLNKVADYFAYHGNFDDVADDAFDNLIDIGIGVRKIGWDKMARGGEGELWAENCDIESMGWSKTRSKKWSDVRWVWQQSTINWESAIRLAPDKAPQLKSMRASLSPEWEKIKTGQPSTALSKDYQTGIAAGDPSYQYPDQIMLWEFWKLVTVPLKKVMWVEQTEIPLDESQQAMPGMMAAPAISIPVPKARMEAIDYQVKEGETAIDTYEDQWWQYLAVTTSNKKDGILLRAEKSEEGFHPYVPMVAQYKKSGQPFGFIENVIPHQKRINISLSQKLSWNNHAIKSPVILRDGDVKDNNLDNLAVQTKIGAVMILSKTAQQPMFNTQPPVSLQAIEEGSVARQDMDFAAAASEPALRGAANASSSGVQLSMLQSAAVTPLNKWVKAERGSELEFWRKALKIIVRNVTPDRIARIVGEQYFQSLLKQQVDPMGNILPPLLELPIQLDVADYDVVIQDQSITDFNKQQSFNAIESLVGGGVPFDDEFRIRNAPIKNTDEALISNQKKKQDIMQQMMLQMQMMGAQIDELSKQVGKNAPGQRRNAQSGKSAPQTRQGMLGGTSPSRP